MKKIFIIILCLIICFTTWPLSNTYAEFKVEAISYRQTLYKDAESEDFLWETLNQYAPTPELAAAILGFFWRESYYKSNAIAHWATMDKRHDQDNSAIFTEKVDAGLVDGSTKEYFVDQVHNQIGGYGLGQWHAYTYLNAFYDFAQEWGTSIADAEMQCAFTVWSVQNQCDKHIKDLDTHSVLKASKWMAYVYDGSKTAEGVIYQKAKTIYKIKNAE